MWLLAGVQPLRALRMSHRLTFFTSPTARAVSGWLWVLRVGGVWVCLFGSCVLHVQ